ncbi:LOW QUALITY PROTEIN: sialic acid-binding Ig-like lectin 11 [Erethizon dorsatum]
MLLPALLLPLLWAGECGEHRASQVGAGLQLSLCDPLGSLQEEPSYWLQVQKLVTVQENLCVLVSCSFSYPQGRWQNSTPTYGYWYRQRDNSRVDHTTDQLVATNDPSRKAETTHKHRFHLLGDPGAKNCSLIISEAQNGDSGRYYFRVERGRVKYNYVSPMLTVIVTELTQIPDIHIPEPLVSGHLSHLVCSMPGACSGDTEPTFSWTGAALRPLGLGLGVHNSSRILLRPRPQDHGTHLTCGVTFPEAGVTKERTVQLSVLYPPQSLSVSVTGAHGTALDTQRNGSYLEVHQGQLLRLLCADDSRPPATLTWDLGGRVLSQSPPSEPRPLKLKLPRVKAGDAGRYTCAENSLGSQHRTLDLSVQYPPEDLRVTVSQANSTVLEILRNGTSLPVLEGQSLRLVCVTHSNPPARLSWARGTQTLSPSWPSAPGVLELPRVQMEHEGEVTCHAENPLGTRSVSLSLSVHYAPQLRGPWCSWEAEGLQCSCSSQAWPEPSLGWRLGERLLEGNSSNASFTVTSSLAGPWANSSLSLHGGLNSGLRLGCEAQNVHGVQSATVLLLGERPAHGAGLLTGVSAGAGTALLLSVCAFLVFSSNSTEGRTELTAAVVTMGTVYLCEKMQMKLGMVAASWGHQKAPRADTPLDSPACAVEEQRELQYASLSFQGLSPQEPPDLRDPSTAAYAEIIICK